jgi:hypothetical protein
MGNGEAKSLQPDANWENFQQHIFQLNQCLNQNRSFLKAHMKLREMRLEARFVSSSYVPNFIAKKWFESRTTVSLIYRFNLNDESESGLEDDEHVQWRADQFLAVSENLLDILSELRHYNDQFRKTFSVTL